VIAAGFVLFAIGAADLVREFVPASRRWVGLLAGAIVLIALGAFSAALPAALLALIVAAGWIWLTPVGARSRAGFWPVVFVGAVAGILIAVFPARADAGLIGEVWGLQTPIGPLSFDQVVLIAGTVVFLLESANVVVRTALAQGSADIARVTSEAMPDTDESTDAVPVLASESQAVLTAGESADPTAPAGQAASPEVAGSASRVEPALKGGRLIGPLERLLVLALTLAAMYPLVAAILAAKGIVRFPEISRDSAAGNRAEYFLIGSLVSWVLALAGAFLVWWAVA
jgi:hypothetical protein